MKIFWYIATWMVFCLYIFLLLKIITGNHPFLSKGPYAHFFGGKDVIKELSDEKPGKHLLFLYLASVLFNLAIFGNNRTARFTISCFHHLKFSSVQKVSFSQDLIKATTQENSCWELFECPGCNCDHPVDDSPYSWYGNPFQVLIILSIIPQKK